MVDFTCLTITPAALPHPAIALAAARAGAIAILDLEFCRESDRPRAIANLATLTAQLAANVPLGLRLRADRLDTWQDVLEQIGDRPHWLALSAWETVAPPSLVRTLPPSRDRRLLLEVTDASPQCWHHLQQSDSQLVQGVLAKGSESGGRVGADAAFILAQKLLSRQPHPVYVQGGIGRATAAGFRACGAAGIVLDDQLWLMPESPLGPERQELLGNCAGQEAIALGRNLGATYRVLVRPELAGGRNLQQLAAKLELQVDGTPDVEWQTQAPAQIGWGDAQAFPVGQAIALAGQFAREYRTTGRAIRALLQTEIPSQSILAPNAPLARSHRTPYPLVQGPMTRVSDTPAFAKAVADGGALPWLALALMKGEQVETLLSETQACIGDRPWGVGILGFAPPELRAAQLEVVHRYKPPFALIAGGRPDQAARLEAAGIASYIHVPTAKLLRLFLAEGARRFVFEGRECGGHIGPLSSCVLWETAIAVLLAEVKPEWAQDVHILFAGGIHDARSGAFVNAIAAPLAERGIRCGVLVGSGYLFTQDAVAAGAIVPRFQQAALECDRTAYIELGPGHAIRCTDSPFIEEFAIARRTLIRQGVRGDALHEALEKLTLGRLRAASKGLERNAEGTLAPLDATEQWQRGMYMVGQVATMRDRVTTIAELHREICEDSQAYLAPAPEISAPEPVEAIAPEAIAVVGMSAILPGAGNVETYWQNILDRVSAIGEVPREVWDWRLYYDSDRSARDKSYSKWGGFIDEVAIDPVRFGIPPKAMKSISPSQLLALAATQQAIDDAGYADASFDRENTAIIFANADGGGSFGHLFIARTMLDLAIPEIPETAWERLPEWDSDAYAGTLDNVVSGRIANRLNLGGKNFTVNSACASSLSALDIAMQELSNRRCNLAIAGAVDTTQSPYAFVAFSKTHALSPQGRPRTFDKAADGIAIGEGVAVLVLKRLSDAERDGDRIYALLRGVGGSSDGKALGMTAPLPAGQMRALQRAYHQAQIDPATLGLVEAHGTGTPVGDRAELETVVETLKASGASPNTCAIGSVKTLIGHTKATAGLAGAIKSIYALNRQVLPPHAGVETPLDPLVDRDSPVYLAGEPRPWLARPDGIPRRCGVSAFGFGGTNAHAVFEEYRGDVRPRATGSEIWPCELFVWREENRDRLAGSLSQLQTAIADGAAPALRDLAYTLAVRAKSQSDRACCLSLVCGDLAELQQQLGAVSQHLLDSSQPLPEGAYLSDRALPAEGKIAFLFPGQSSQYPNMAREAALYFPEMRAAIEATDRLLREQFSRPLSQWIYPSAAFSDGDRQQQWQDLTETRIAQPAIGAVSVGFLDFARRLGLTPDMVGGHSYGELVALHCAGVVSREDFIRVSEIRGRVISEGQTGEGTMAAVWLSREAVNEMCREIPGLVLANHNAPEQCTIAGTRSAVEQAMERLQQQGTRAQWLNVSGAFHSPLVAPVGDRLAAEIADLPLHPPALPVYSNLTAQPYDGDPSGIRQQLVEHLLTPVRFVEQIEQMYADGARVFVELGPKSILTKLVQMILPADADYTAVSFDGRGRNLRSCLQAIAQLVAAGVEVDVVGLFRDRAVRSLDLARLAATTRPPAVSKTTWYINGIAARPQSEPVAHVGKLPLLSEETRQQERQQQQRSASPTSASASTQPGSTQNGATTSPTQNGANAIAPDTNATLAAYQAYQETMRQFLAVQESVMGQFLNGNGQVPSSNGHKSETQFAVEDALKGGDTRSGSSAQVPVPQAIAPPVSHSTNGDRAPETNGNGRHSPARPPEPTATPQLDRAGLSELLVEVVSESSGYPSDMLGLDLDLEADLGIDSIARTEIFSTLRQKLPDAIAAALSEDAERLSRVKTINGLVEAILEVAPVGETAPPAEIAAAPSTPQLDRAGLSELLVEVVSESSGYPSDMLGLDLDLEADLGIDSIARTEIFSTLRQKLPDAIAAALSEDAERLSRVKTINGLVEAILEVAPVGETAPPAEIAAAPSTPQLDRAGLTELLVQVVSESSGYPSDMLGLDLDLEADLGIDSIARTEIFSTLRQKLPDAIAAALSEDAERLSRVKTISGLVEAILAVETEPRSPVASPSHSQPVEIAADSPTCPRCAIAPHPTPLDSQAPLVPEGTVLVVGREDAIAKLVAAALEKQGVRVALLGLDPQNWPAQLERVREQGRIGGIVNLASTTVEPLPENLAAWRSQIRVQVTGFFQLLQACAGDLQATPGAAVLSASLLGGNFGRDGRVGVGSALSGGPQGLLKTLANEWPDVRAKAVDFDPHREPPAIADLIAAEFLHRDRQVVEVGYPESGRVTFRAVASSDRPSGFDLRPQKDWVILATGGAKGITARIARELVVPGVTLVLVGRSPEPDAEAPATAGIADAGGLRQAFIEAARTAGETPKPVAIERQVQSLLKAREMRENLDTLRRAGAKVEYRAADVRDETAFAGILEDIYQRHGRIDAVLHGAGTIEDKRLVDKSLDSFDRVFSTKIDSAYLLQRHLRRGLKLAVFFSSIAAWIGNPGQCDYAAANDVLNRIAWQMQQQHPDAKVVAIGWGPWQETGMASDALNRMFRERGIVPIPTDAGCRFVLEELQTSDRAAEVLAGEGPWVNKAVRGSQFAVRS